MVRQNPVGWANPVKTKLVVKSKMLKEEQQILMAAVYPLLMEVVIRNSNFVTKYIEDKVTTRMKELEVLTMIAELSPQAAHSAFVHGMQHKWSSFQRTMRMLFDTSSFQLFLGDIRSMMICEH
jgi:hypothetical protein